MRVEVDHPQEFGFPLWRHGRRQPRRFAWWEGGDPTAEKAFEDALDGIAAAEDNRRNLGDRAPLMGEQDHLSTQPQLGIGSCIVEVSQFGHLRGRQRR